MPYKKKIWCPHPSHANLTRTGSKPSHPSAVRIINEMEAQALNKQVMSNSEWTSVVFKAEDKICQRCFNSLPTLVETWFDSEAMAMKSSPVDSPHLPLLVEEFKKGSAKRELNAVFQLLKMETIRDDRRYKQIRQQVDEVYQYLCHLCDTLERSDQLQSLESKPLILPVDDSNDLLHGLKELFNESSDSEQIRLMTIAPTSWGRVKLCKWFDSTDSQARQAILLRDEKGVLAFPEYSRGNKFLENETIEQIVQFYLEDGISRVSSNTKDVLKIKNELVAVRYMEMTVGEALRKFYAEYPSIQVGKSSFFALRPRQVKLNSPHETCMCQVHENMSLVLQAYNKYVQKTLAANTHSNKVTASDLIDLGVCNAPTLDCFESSCVQCSKRLPSSILRSRVQIIDEDDEWTWSMWKTTDKKVDLHHIRGSIMSLLHELDEQWRAFLLHSYYNREQRTYINELRVNSSDSSYAVVQVDFSENYTLVRQREVQAAHWNNMQATLFTIYIKLGDHHKNLVIISNYMRHDTAFVYCAQRLIVKFLKEHCPRVTRVNYLSDGAPSHFKNHSNIINLIHHKADFGLDACWTFSASGHGKGPSDGIGAAVKSNANRSILTSGITLSSVKDFFDFTRKSFNQVQKLDSAGDPPIHTLYLESATVEDTTERLLNDRWKHSEGRIKGIRGFHEFNPKDNGIIECRRTSNSTRTTAFVFHDNQQHANKNSYCRKVNEVKDISTDDFVLVAQDDKHHLAQVLALDSPQQIVVQYYTPAFPLRSYVKLFRKVGSPTTTHSKQIIASLADLPQVQRRGDRVLSKEQFTNIQNFRL